jgi:hypothetical protein
MSRFTDAELAAEYWLASRALWLAYIDRATLNDYNEYETMLREEASTMYRFAYYPHALEA